MACKQQVKKSQNMQASLYIPSFYEERGEERNLKGSVIWLDLWMVGLPYAAPFFGSFCFKILMGCPMRFDNPMRMGRSVCW